MEYNAVECFKALADPIRLSIIQRLKDDRELCACNLLEDFEISQPTLSFHMKKLTACGLVNVRRDGIWMKYSVNVDFVDHLIEDLGRVRQKSESLTPLMNQSKVSGIR